MIKVQFKNNYENVYSGREYLYNDYDNAEVGDIVVVNTCQGYAIARVSTINVALSDINIDLNRIQTVEKVIITKKELDLRAKLKYEKQVKMNEFAAEAKRKMLLGYLSGFTTNEDLLKEIASWSTAELETIVELIK